MKILTFNPPDFLVDLTELLANAVELAVLASELG